MVPCSKRGVSETLRSCGRTRDDRRAKKYQEPSIIGKGKEGSRRQRRRQQIEAAPSWPWFLANLSHPIKSPSVPITPHPTLTKLTTNIAGFVLRVNVERIFARSEE
ncbi:hypothetical protein ANO14919_140180 [Xylariales sp. No.14919]|nr:hypothetical protein ANO14919_140180 [Xylariales sp. No.14919]